MEINVRDYGAIGDGRTSDTEAIQKAIDDCFCKKAKRVVLSDGIFCCGTLYLKSDVELYLNENATLLASGDIRDYGVDTHHNRYRNEPELDRCFIFAEDQKNISITGKGKILGNAGNFPNKGDIYRPMLIRLLRCKNIRLEGVSLLDAAAWTTAFLDSENIDIKNVYIENHKNYNGDGLDFDGCRGVSVRNCTIIGTDDNLCLQSSSRDYPMTDVRIQDVNFTSICAGIRIGLKSIGTISNVKISNCNMKNVNREGIKIECTEGGVIEDISIENLKMENVRRPVFILLNNRFVPDDLGSSIELEKMPAIGMLRNISIENLEAIDDESMKEIHYRLGDKNDIMGQPKYNGIKIDANKDHPIENLRLKNIFYRTYGGVSLEEIPSDYPEVLDRLLSPDTVSVDNYFPEYSRAKFIDIRNVKGLFLEEIITEEIHPDERPGMIISTS